MAVADDQMLGAFRKVGNEVRPGGAAGEFAQVLAKFVHRWFAAECVLVGPCDEAGVGESAVAILEFIRIDKFVG
ncbi:hypothetical protein LP7551_01904 [Roseibium album]|nr:hypothetical protein LP7551_01904 [Roseibium album]